MLLILHITTSLLSIFAAAINMVFPTRRKIFFIFLLTSLSVISGIFLVILTNYSVGKACVSGIFYLLLVGTLTVPTVKHAINSER